ncbi:MAG: CHAP domain-containing protein [Oscillospiraceae bacterium]|nr:CHAP domain-containing protein [Oscillospiraceae bacterium]
MPDIKTRVVAEKTVKTLDKSAIAAQRMKSAYVQAKEKAERSAPVDQESPESYAADRVSDEVNTAVFEGVHQLDRQGRKGLETTKANIAKAKERFQRKRMIDPLKKKARKGAAEPARPPVEVDGNIRRNPSTRRAANPVHRPAGRSAGMGRAAHGKQASVKTVERAGKTVKQGARSTGRAVAKTAGRTVKSAQDSVKTAEAMGRTAAKTAYQTAKASQRMAQTAAATAKKAAETSMTAVRAIITGTRALIAAIAAGGWVAMVMLVVICLIGLIVSSPFGIFFSGEDSGTGQTMPTAVREINQDYEDKLEEIKTGNAHDVLEMSGSRAVWPEVLAVYAVKTSTAPDNPLEVATMDGTKKELLKEIFWAMNEVDYSTNTAAHNVVTETDDGHGNIVETTTRVTETTLYITVSHKTADEMADIYSFTADQRAQLAELLAEENRSMWSAVLYGIGAGDGEIVTVALSQIGNVGGQPYWSWYGFGSRVDWCAIFVSWCANECGYIDAGVIPKFAGCITGSQWFKDRGLWQDRNYEPRPGDLVFFDWDNPGGFSGPQDGLCDHVGIVEKVENGVVYTVEGNSGDKCREAHYPVGHYEIYGYGTPAY